MISGLIQIALKSVAGRVFIGAAVAAILSTVAYWWYDTKHDWEERGREECVQLVNEETHKNLVAANYRKQEQIMKLQKELRETKIENELARERERRANEQLLIYKNSIRTQAENDEDYREWADTPLPDGVADRLRSLRANSN
jgi:glucan-binding YG repeat protein